MSQGRSNVYKLRDIVNVKDPVYGAKGDGATDDAAAWQAAIDVGQGITIWGPAGTYMLGSPVNFKTQRRIQGEGIGTVLKALSTWNPSVPTVAAGTYSPALDFAPLLYNASPIDWWEIADIELDGNDEDCYGLYLHENFHGQLRNVTIINTNKRPYTNIRGQSITHENFTCYDCGDGVLTYDNTGFSFIGSGFERLAGEWSYDQRQPNGFAKGGVLLDNCWFESDSSRFPTEGFLRMSGRRNRVNAHFAFHAAATTERMLELNDNTASRLADGITMTSSPCLRGRFEVNNASGAMLIKAATNSGGNRVSGTYTASKVDDDGTGNTFDVNGSLSTQVQHVTRRFQVRHGDIGSGIPIVATNYVIDIDHNAGTPEIRMLGSANNKFDSDSGNLRLTSNLGQRYVTTNGSFSWTASATGYVFNGASGATGYTKPIYVGSYALWVDSTGDLRIKSGAPTSDTDGTVVGTQS